jgi:hypothetical protein
MSNIFVEYIIRLLSHEDYKMVLYGLSTYYTSEITLNIQWWNFELVDIYHPYHTEHPMVEF